MGCVVLNDWRIAQSRHSVCLEGFSLTLWQVYEYILFFIFFGGGVYGPNARNAYVQISTTRMYKYDAYVP